jgi:hypothetical protein
MDHFLLADALAVGHAVLLICCITSASLFGYQHPVHLWWVLGGTTMKKTTIKLTPERKAKQDAMLAVHSLFIGVHLRKLAARNQ